MSVERGDIAYVGRVNSRFVILAQLRTEDGWEPIYRTMIHHYYYGTVLSGGILTKNITDNTKIVEADDQILYFDATRVNDGWKFQGFYWDGEDRRGMGYDGDTILRVGYQANPHPDATFTMTPDDPSGYDNNYLWTGVRYIMTTEDAPDLTILYLDESVIDNTSDTNLNGLLEYSDDINPPYQSADIADVRFTLIPIDMFKWLNNKPTTTSRLDPVIQVAQCALYPDSGYGQGSYCTNWQNNRGFTTEQDVQPIIYYYSQDGTCGNSYTFTNYWNEQVNVNSSLGMCTNNDCNYYEGRFICGEGNSGNGDDSDGEDSLLNNRVLILLVLGAIILIILVVIIIVVFFYMNRDDETQSEAESNSGTVMVI